MPAHGSRGIYPWLVHVTVWQKTPQYCKVISVQFSHSVVSDSATPWTAACQASVSITNSRSLLKLVSIESMMPSNHLIPCCPLVPCMLCYAKSLQSCPTLCDPIDGSPPGFPVPGILQARTLEWVAISSSNAWKWKEKVKSLSRVRLLATPRTAAYQTPPSMGFSRQEYWSGVPLPSPSTLYRMVLINKLWINEWVNMCKLWINEWVNMY